MAAAVWMEGAGACRGYVKRDDNPYDPESYKGKEWTRGWDIVFERRAQCLKEQDAAKAHLLPKSSKL